MMLLLVCLGCVALIAGISGYWLLDVTATAASVRSCSLFYVSSETAAVKIK